MSGYTEICYEVVDLNLGHEINQQNDRLPEVRSFIFLILFLCGSRDSIRPIICRFSRSNGGHIFLLRAESRLSFLDRFLQSS